MCWATKSVSVAGAAGQGARGRGGAWLRIFKRLHCSPLPAVNSGIAQWAEQAQEELEASKRAATQRLGQAAASAMSEE
eukprot:5326867-Pyramimonas_sp.AAC.1